MRPVTLIVAALLVAPLLATTPAGAGAGPRPTDRAQQAAPTYDATVRNTRHGIPHVVAGDWASLGYGSGYATAASSICNFDDTLLTARGERSKYLTGP